MDEATPANLAAALSGLQPKDKAPNSSRVHRLPRFSRATTDLDGLVRGDLDRFIAELDQVFARPWGPCTLLRDPVETINVPGRLVKPRRFDVVAQINGATWRRVQVEIAADEGSAGADSEPLPQTRQRSACPNEPGRRA